MLGRLGLGTGVALHLVWCWRFGNWKGTWAWDDTTFAC